MIHITLALPVSVWPFTFSKSPSKKFIRLEIASLFHFYKKKIKKYHTLIYKSITRVALTWTTLKLFIEVFLRLKVREVLFQVVISVDLLLLNDLERKKGQRKKRGKSQTWNSCTPFLGCTSIIIICNNVTENPLGSDHVQAF